MTKHYDYLAIGGGSGGIASINRAAMYGQKCALIEAKELGGTCVNVGCVPKKVMWHAAQIAEAIHQYGPDYGFDTTVNAFDWKKLVANRTAYIDRIHNSYDNVLGKNKVDVIKGFARFVDAHTVEVNGELITADHILIATGGRPSHPAIPGAEYGIDSDGFFELDAMPKRVAVVGAGYIAVEIAGVLNALGARAAAQLRSDDRRNPGGSDEHRRAEPAYRIGAESDRQERRRQPDAAAGKRQGIHRRLPDLGHRPRTGDRQPKPRRYRGEDQRARLY